MFAAITPALITGAFAERKRFGVVRPLHRSSGRSSSTRRSPTGSGRPTAGCSSSARSTSPAARSSTPRSGVSALIVALLIGKRVVNGDRMEPHDIPMTVLGAGLLWFGWFGFNAGLRGRPPTASPPTRSSSRIPPPPRRPSPGSARATSTSARSASSAPPAAPSPASSRSPRHPGFVTAGGALLIGLVGRRPLLQRDPPPRADQGRRRARRLRRPRRRRRRSARSRPASSRRARSSRPTRA